MAGASSVPEDGTILSRLDRALFRVEGWMILVGGLAVFSLMLLAVVSVGGRNFFGRPLAGYVDWIEQAMPLIAFMGVAYTQRVGGHIRMDMAVGALRGRALWAAELMTTLLMLTLTALLTWGAWAHFERAFSFDAPLWSNDSSMDIGLPLWPAKLLAPVAFGVLTLRLALQVWAYARALRMGAVRPAAVPLIEDAATVAAKEAATVQGVKE